MLGTLAASPPTTGEMIAQSGSNPSESSSCRTWSNRRPVTKQTLTSLSQTRSDVGRRRS